MSKRAGAWHNSEVTPARARRFEAESKRGHPLASGTNLVKVSSNVYIKTGLPAALVRAVSVMGTLLQDPALKENLHTFVRKVGHRISDKKLDRSSRRWESQGSVAESHTE